MQTRMEPPKKFEDVLRRGPEPLRGEVPTPVAENPLRILFVTSAHNSLSQRCYIAVTEMGHDVTVQVVDSPALIEAAVGAHEPDLVVCPMLKQFIPESVSSKYTCLVVHPGPHGDRGPSSLDWAIELGMEEWGVTVLEAVEEAAPLRGRVATRGVRTATSSVSGVDSPRASSPRGEHAGRPDSVADVGRVAAVPAQRTDRISLSNVAMCAARMSRARSGWPAEIASSTSWCSWTRANRCGSRSITRYQILSDRLK